jgi:hypothetical protein
MRTGGCCAVDQVRVRPPAKRSAGLLFPVPDPPPARRAQRQAHGDAQLCGRHEARVLHAKREAEALHVEERATRFPGKTVLYLDQRRGRLERVLELADRFLLSGREVQVHALLPKATHAARRTEKHATGNVRVPFQLE